MALRLSKFFFLLLVFSLPLVRPFNTSFFNLLVPYTDFIFPGAFGFWVIAVFQKKIKLRTGGFYFFLLLYAFSLTVSTVFSTDREHSLYKLFGEFYLIALAVLAFNLVQSPEFLKRVVQAWLLGTFLTILASLAGLILFYLGHQTPADNYFLSRAGSLPTGNYPRLHALFANANMTCNFLNVSLMFALLAGKLAWLGKFWARILYSGIWFAAFFTLSPGLGGLFLSLGVWLWANFDFAKRRTAAVLAGLAGILLASAFFAAALISLDTPNTARDFRVPLIEQKFEPSVRVLVWQNSLQTISEFPFLGKGTGTDVAAVEYLTLSGERQHLRDAHNVWLNQFGQLGLVGLTAFTLFCGYLLRQGRFSLTAKTEQSSVRLALACAFLGAFLYQGLVGAFEDARHLWILFGLLAGCGRENSNEEDNFKGDQAAARGLGL